MTHLSEKEFAEELRMEKLQEQSELSWLMDSRISDNQPEMNANWDDLDTFREYR